MNSSRAKLVVLVVFVLTLCAGMTAGIVAARLPGATSLSNNPTAPVVGAGLTSELNLSVEQNEKMQKVWEGVRDLSEESLAKARSADAARNDAIRELVPADKMDQYNKIQRNYAETVAAMDGRRKRSFSDAVNQTLKILSPSQQKKYNEILQKRLGAENVGEHDPLEGAAGPTPASQPAL